MELLSFLSLTVNARPTVLIVGRSFSIYLPLNSFFVSSRIQRKIGEVNWSQKTFKVKCHRAFHMWEKYCSRPSRNMLRPFLLCDRNERDKDRNTASVMVVSHENILWERRLCVLGYRRGILLFMDLRVL